jgi:diguanylate cyclase (GGDEF)-like protein/PAS domain S-box-containing protein
MHFPKDPGPRRLKGFPPAPLADGANEKQDGASRDRTESELQRYRELFQLAPGSYLVTDATGTIVEANQASATLLNTHPEYLAGQPLLLFVDEKGRRRLDANLTRLRRGEQVDGWEVRMEPRRGAPFPATLDVAPAHDVQGHLVGLQWQVQDITEHKRAEEEMAFAAAHDPLTGLPNRSKLEELLGLAVARGRRRNLAVALLFIDLDNFKLVNDSLGHAAGDELLCQVASRLSGVSRDTDSVARMSGDEFVLLLADLERGDQSARAAAPPLLVSQWVATRVEECMQAPFALEGTDVDISASIGIASYPFDGEDAIALLASADAAMYRSKKRGPGGWAASATQAPHPKKNTSFTARLKAAVEGEQWVLHYQPIVDLVPDRLIGVEALIRWREGNGTLIRPGEFISLAEDIGLIESIGDWVLKELCAQFRLWQDLGQEIEISYNVSPHQLWDPDFAQKVFATLESAGVAPSNLVIELTESVGIAGQDRRQQMLWDLHDGGLRVAIDDFGTGHSSLSRLKYLPIDILKIDRSFVRDLLVNRGAESLATAIIEFSRSLGFTPLAEGIETEEQRRFLTERGCTLGQGYWLGRPLPQEEITPSLVGRGPAESSPAGAV